MMIPPVPSPIGHALSGVAIAWMAEKSDPRLTPSALVCASLAAIPDIDLLVLPMHRSATHSLLTALLVFIVAAVVTGWVNRAQGVHGVHEVHGARWRFAAVCALAYASHSVLDWMGKDASVPYGLQMFWPLSDRWFISPWPLLPGTERRDIFSERSMLINLRAAVTELVVFGGIVLTLRVRRIRRSPGQTSGQGSRPQPSA